MPSGGAGKGPYLVLDEQGALWRVGEVGCCSLHHQLEGGAWFHIPQVLLPQDGARTALNAKKLRKNTWES